MPCRLLIRAIENTQDPGNLLASQKGDIVSIAAANWVFGAQETLPNWIIVTLSDVTYRQALEYHGQWLRTPQLEVVAHNPALDSYRLRLSGKTPSASGKGGITRAEAQEFIDDWGATHVGNTKNSVTFVLSVKNAGFSRGFWGHEFPGVVFAESNYDEATGKHVVTADYSAIAFHSNTVAHQAISRGADVLDNDSGVLTFEIDRLDIKAEMLRDIHEKLSHMIGKTRYAITEAAVDTVVAGEVTFTKAQLLSVLIDRADG